VTGHRGRILAYDNNSISPNFSANKTAANTVQEAMQTMRPFPATENYDPTHTGLQHPGLHPHRFLTRLVSLLLSLELAS